MILIHYFPLAKKIQILAMKKEWGKQVLVKLKLVLKCVYNFQPGCFCKLQNWTLLFLHRKRELITLILIGPKIDLISAYLAYAIHI